MSSRIILTIIVAFVALFVFSGCNRPVVQPGLQPHFTCFRDIPGVTAQEIAAIEALQEQFDYFTFGNVASIETFYNMYGNVAGFSALLCEWLTELFGIPFIPGIHLLGSLFEGLESSDISFSAATIPEERREYFFMTDPIAMRVVKYFRIAGREPIEVIRRTRLPRYALLRGSRVTESVLQYATEEFEPVFVNSFIEAGELLKNGEVDTLVASSIVLSNLKSFGDIVTDNFLPLLFVTGHLNTMNPQFEPVISVFNKAILHGAAHHLNSLYRQGTNEYFRNELFLRLTQEERNFIQNNPVIPFLANPDNYPVSFFNVYENQWQGIAFDILREIESLTGLEIRIANEPGVPLPVLFEMLDSGEALMAAGLSRTCTSPWVCRFSCSSMPLLRSQSALISTIDFPNIRINEIYSLRIGLLKYTMDAELFHRWFPNHNKVFYYSRNIFEALIAGEVDAVMATTCALLRLANFYGYSDFKANFIFNNTIESFFCFTFDTEIFSSIVNKALNLINIEDISEQWQRKTFDHRFRQAREATRTRVRWAISSIVIVFVVFYVMTFTYSIYTKRKIAAEGWAYANKLGSKLTDITKSSVLFAGVMKDAVEMITKEGCRGLNATRANIWRISDDKKHVECLCCYHISSGEFGVMDSLDLADYYDCFQQLKVQRLLVTNSYDKPNLLTKYKQDYSTDIVSSLDAPIRIDGEIVGIFCVEQDSCKAYPKKREWTIEEQNFSSSLADFIALAITNTKLLNARREADSANRTKSAFLANMSHELRTPLNVVIGLTDLTLEEQKLPPKVTENLHKISSAGGSLLGIVNDILDFSKVESGNLSICPSVYHTASLLSDVTALLTTRLKEKTVTFKLNIQDNMPAKLYGDSLRVKQVINNLLSNAFKFTKEGTIELAVDCLCNKYSDFWMNITVSDTGIGIREKDMKKLFKDYYQIENDASKKKYGTGLGLSITKRLIQLMNGAITVESEYGKGSVFRAHIRQGFVDNSQIGSEIAENLRSFRYKQSKRAASKKLERADLSFARVLVVDDMQTNLDVAAGILRKYKMQVDCVLSGQQAIDLIKTGQPVYDAIFMDHMMPEIDGIEAVKIIRSLGTVYARNIPVIALTANAIKGTESLFYANGFQAFISKPIDIMLLDSVVREWIHKEAA